MVATFLEYVYCIRRVSIMLLCHLVCDQFQVKSLRMKKSIFFLIFVLKNLILTNFNHYSPIWGDFWCFWTIFWMFKFFHLNFFFYAMFRNLLPFCLTSNHLETKLNYQKHIKYYEIHLKKIKKKIV